MMTVSINFKFKNASRIYLEKDLVDGIVTIDSRAEGKHDGVFLVCEGLLCTHISQKSTGILDSLVQTSKPVVLSHYSEELAKSGKLPAGRLQLPFSFTLNAKPNKTLYETYHGNNIVIQYTIRCDIKRSLLSKDLSKSQEIFVHNLVSPGKAFSVNRKNFEISPKSAQNAKERAHIPEFYIEGYFDTLDCNLKKPFTGEICVKHCDSGITSINLQLVRIETSASDGNEKEVSEIQNTQIASGDVARGLPILIFMVWPRLLTCCTVITPTFALEFQMNIVILFENDHQIIEPFPLQFFRQ